MVNNNLRDTHIPEITLVSIELDSGKILTGFYDISFDRNEKPHIIFHKILNSIHDLLPHKSLPDNKYYDFKNSEIFLGHGGPKLIVENISEIKNGDTLVIVPSIRERPNESESLMRSLERRRGLTLISDISTFEVKNLSTIHNLMPILFDEKKE